MSNKTDGFFYIDPVDSATLRADLSAALARAEQAEKAAAIWEQRFSQATALSGEHLADLAAARRENERLRARLESAVGALGQAMKMQCHVNGLPAELCGCKACRGLQAAHGVAGEEQADG